MKPLRRAWRVEHAVTGRGPWSGGEGPWSYDVNRLPHNEDPSRMPCTWTDTCKRERRYNGGRFAFPDAKTLAYWAGPAALRAAHDAGYVCRVYGCSWEHHSFYENQIVFDHHRAVLLREVSLLEIPVELEVCRLRQMAARHSSPTILRSTSLALPEYRGDMLSLKRAA